MSYFDKFAAEVEQLPFTKLKEATERYNKLLAAAEDRDDYLLKTIDSLNRKIMADAEERRINRDGHIVTMARDLVDMERNLAQSVAAISDSYVPFMQLILRLEAKQAKEAKEDR